MRRSPRYLLRDRAEKTWPFRATVTAPDQGFGVHINLMLAWVRAEAGAWGEGYEQYPAPRQRGGPDAIRFYFRDREVRDRFLSEGVPAGLEAGAEDRPELEDGSGRA